MLFTMFPLSPSSTSIQFIKIQTSNIAINPFKVSNLKRCKIYKSIRKESTGRKAGKKRFKAGSRVQASFQTNRGQYLTVTYRLPMHEGTHLVGAATWSEWPPGAPTASGWTLLLGLRRLSNRAQGGWTLRRCSPELHHPEGSLAESQCSEARITETNCILLTVKGWDLIPDEFLAFNLVSLVKE